MKKKLVLKPFVLPTLYLFLIIMLMVIATKSLYKEKPKEENLEYVSDTVVEETIPVLEEIEVYVLNPYSGDNIHESTGYYDYKAEKDSQEKSIIQYGNTYIQNTGITYSSDNDFKVIAIMDGTVSKIYENELLGNVVEITHSNNLVSVYQMVKDIKVKEGDNITSGFEIATSGNSKLMSSGSNLHFEIIKEGKNQNPKNIIGKNIKEI